jgi:hypothetical protein
MGSPIAVSPSSFLGGAEGVNRVMPCFAGSFVNGCLSSEAQYKLGGLLPASDYTKIDAGMRMKLKQEKYI